MRRPLSRSKLRPAAGSLSGMELLEDRLTLSHAPPFGGEYSSFALGEFQSAATYAQASPTTQHSSHQANGSYAIAMSGQSGSRFDPQQAQAEFQDRRFESLAGRSAGFDSGPGHYVAAPTWSSMQGGGSMAFSYSSGMRGFEPLGRSGMNYTANTGITQIATTSPAIMVFVFSLTPNNVEVNTAAEISSVERDHSERLAEPRPDRTQIDRRAFAAR